MSLKREGIRKNVHWLCICSVTSVGGDTFSHKKATKELWNKSAPCLWHENSCKGICWWKVVLLMSPPPTAFLSSSRVIGSHIKVITKETMKKAEVFSLKKQSNCSGAEPLNCGVPCDGTWQKRDYLSRNGCVTVISMDTAKVIDVEALNQGCKQREHHEHLDKTSLEYQTWKTDHT